MTLNKTTLSLEPGGEETLTATISPATASNKNVTWTSSDTTVATVDANGKVTAVKNGTATITATTEDGTKTATCAVTVTTSVTGVTLNKTTLTIAVGNNETLTATISPATASNKNVTWTSSDATVATVDASGKVTGVKNGTATITVTTEDGAKTATCAVTVITSVTGVTLNKTTLSLEPTGVETLTATVSPDNATNKNVTWTSSNTGIATVDANGKVTAVAVGTATITVTTADGSKTASCTVTISTDKDLTSFFDPEFLKKLKDAGVISSASKIMQSEAEGITSINVAGTYKNRGTLTSLKGIEYLTNLKQLYVSYNSLASLDLSKNTKLETLSANYNKLTSVNVKNCVELTTLELTDNQLTSIDISTNTKLAYVYLTRNSLTALDTSKNTLLKTLDVYVNNLTSLDLSANTALTNITVGNNLCNSEEKFIVTVAKGFSIPDAFTSDGSTWYKNGIVVTLVYQEKK